MEVEIEKEKIRSTSSVTLLLRVHVDDKQNFNEHINQLNVLIRPESFLGLKDKGF